MNGPAARSRYARRLLGAGIVGPPLFCAVFLADGAVHPAYDAWRDQVSLLSLGDWGWVQIANFLVFGVLMLAFAAGLRMRLSHGKAATWGPILFGTFGLALLLAGVFVADAQPEGGGPLVVINSQGMVQQSSQLVTAHGLVHDLAALVGFGSLAVACFVLARRFRADGWTGFAVYSRVSGLLTAALFVLSNAAPYGWAGLVQRAAVFAGWIWIALAAWRLASSIEEKSSPAGSGRPDTALAPRGRLDDSTGGPQ